ncbi:MAG: hypothetical protein CBB76_03875, partial [Crocinitomicaceae bacterium TMED16]
DDEKKQNSPYNDEIYYSIRKRTSELFKHYPTLLHKEVGLNKQGAQSGEEKTTTEKTTTEEGAKEYKSINKCVEELTKIIDDTTKKHGKYSNEFISYVNMLKSKIRSITNELTNTKFEEIKRVFKLPTTTTTTPHTYSANIYPYGTYTNIEVKAADNS